MSKLKTTVVVGIATAAMIAGVAMPMIAGAEEYTFTTTLKLGSRGTAVLELQKLLNTDPDTQVSTTGAGSPGSETTYFGSKTKTAVIKFQNKYASEVLEPIGLTSGTGVVGSMTRAKLNTLSSGPPAAVACGDGIDNDGDTKIDYPADPGCTSATDTNESDIVTGGDLSATAATQPTATLAVQGAARLPFTKVTLTAGSNDVTVTGINVERTGLAHDAVFSGVVLLDENGQQLGIAKTFGSNHQAIVGESFTVKAGQSRTMTIAGNMASSLSSYAGEVPYISVTGVTTSATVVGTFPITGAGHTINFTLAIGSATMARGSVDPNSSVSKSIGTTGYTFSSVKVTAGSAEKIRVKSIRWNQSGSAASADFANIKTYIDSTAYDTTISSDGKYYTAIFGDGIVVDKGNSIEISVKGDIVGGSARTIAFDIYKNTDLYVTGETYGYGIVTPTTSAGLSPFSSTVPTTRNTSTFTGSNPWYYASQVTGSNGTITVTRATSVAATNIAVGMLNQPLGGFDVEVKGEPISISAMAFTVSSSSGSGAGLLTNVTLFDGETAIAGPVDATYVNGLDQLVSFSDSVTFPVGKKTYTLKGKVATGIGSNTTYQASTTPSSNWSNPIGQTTGNAITGTSITSSVVSSNIMTVKAAAAQITVSSIPASQTVVAGTNNLTFTNININTTASGEDIRFSAMPLFYTFDGTANYLKSCQLFDGSTALSSSNIVDPTAAATSTYTLDASFTVPKGTIKTIAVKCNLSSAATTSSTYAWGADYSGFSATGVNSGQAATLTGTRSTGPTMTVGSASLTVTRADSAPPYSLVAAGTSNVTLGALKFTATNDVVTLQQVALQLTNTASSSGANLVGETVYLYDGLTQVGSGQFSDATTTIAAISGVTIPKDGFKVLTIKGDITGIDISTASANEGAFIAVDWDGVGQAGSTNGKNSNGAVVTATGTDTAMAGMRIFKSYPTLTKLDLSSSERALAQGSVDNSPIYRFSIQASSGGNGIGIQTLNVNIATSSVSSSGTTTVTNLKVFAYPNSNFSGALGGSWTSNQIVSQINGLVSSGNNVATTSSILTIPAGSTYYFKVTGTVTLSAPLSGYTSSGWVKVYLDGDTAYPALSTKMGTVNSVSTSKFIWSPIATTTSLATTDIDWTNGYNLTGLPTTGMDTESISK